MPITQLPLMKGLGKDSASADYIDLLPVNMLATPKDVLDSSGYLRSFPGIIKEADVKGTSRGAVFNSAKGEVFRVQGNAIYRSGNYISELGGKERVSMAYSDVSQAVAYDGIMRYFRYDGVEKTLSNWDKSTGYSQFEIGYVNDICRSRGRYAWAKGGTNLFGVTDLDDESHPDRYRPFYSAESQPDGIIGIGTWRDFIVCFGSSSIEYFSLTGSSDSSAAIYVSQPSLMVTKGIAGKFCKTLIGDDYVILSSQATGTPSVFVVSAGRTTKIATSSVEKVLRSYSAADLATSVLESVSFDSHELLLVHLPDRVLCYDFSSSANGPQWSLLKGGYEDGVYRAIDLVFADNKITCGDKYEPQTGSLSFSISSQYGAMQEHILYTPLFKADNARVFDLELESSTGLEQKAEKIFISASLDGLNYGREQSIESGEKFSYDKRILWRKVGRVRKNIGFKFRIITGSPVTLSGCKVRVE